MDNRPPYAVRPLRLEDLRNLPEDGQILELLRWLVEKADD